jgi:predicted O-linked N-acetylglucosamine transferase (SPINDLY family)
VAKIGPTFPARVGVSLLQAAGLPELIAATEDDYAAKVMALYHDRELLARMRQRLVDARASAPLFDMQGFARDLEDLYFTMADETISSQRSIDPCRAAPASAP